MSLIGDRWSWLQHLSVFSLFHPADALSNGHLAAGDVVAFLIIAAVFAAASLVTFERRPTL
jgi:hypothetical protein